MLNKYPYNNGHLLIAPYIHVPGFSDIADDVMLDIMTAVKDCIEAHRKLMSPQGFNVGLNLGAAAGAGITGHIHWHIVPRWEGDVNFMPVTGNTKVIPQALSMMHEMLAKYFRSS